MTVTESRVLTDVVLGGDAIKRASVIERWLGAQRETERWMVVLGARPLGAATGPRLTPRAGVTIADAPAGCACCVGQVTFRVTLTRLLRNARPDRLILDLGPGEHADRLLAMLEDEWFSKAIQIARAERLNA